MIFEKRNIIILLILIGTLAIVGGVYAQDSSDSNVLKTINIAKKVSNSNVKTVTVKINNFPSGVSWGPKATKLKNEELYLALGWLAREGKLTFTEGEAELVVALA